MGGRRARTQRRGARRLDPARRRADRRVERAVGRVCLQPLEHQLVDLVLRGHGAAAGPEEKEVLMARFMRAVAELQHVGLVRRNKRRRMLRCLCRSQQKLFILDVGKCDLLSQELRCGKDGRQVCDEWLQ